MGSSNKSEKKAGREPAGQPSDRPDIFLARQLPAELFPFLLCQEQKLTFQKSMLSRIFKSFIN